MQAAQLLLLICGVAIAKDATVSPVINPLPPSENSNPAEEVGGNYEGDMDIGPTRGKGSNRNALKGEDTKWKDATVCYFYEEGSGQINTRLVEFIDYAVKEISENTCVKFVKKSVPTEGCIKVTDKSSGCFATAGYVDPDTLKYWGRDYQVLNMSPRCAKGSTIHEFLHGLGFMHEQSRPDRDDHINVVFDNIETDYHSQFKKYSLSEVTTLGIPYDYGSIMHYGSYAFSKNDKETILTVPKAGIQLGQRSGMSVLDAKKVNKHYNCPEKTSGGELTTTTIAATTTATIKQITTTTGGPTAKPTPTTTANIKLTPTTVGRSGTTDHQTTGGYATDGYGTGGYATDGYGTGGYATDGYGTGGYATDGYGTDGYATDGYGTGGYATDGYGTGGYATDGYVTGA